MDAREIICRRAVSEFENGQVVNLGIGLPTMIPGFMPEGLNVVMQSENGMLGMGPEPEQGMEDDEYFDAGSKLVTFLPGASFFDSATSFALIRGGHVDMTVLGALQVDAQGSLASWRIPGKWVPGMGGSMDLVVGARCVVVAMEHITKNGEARILDRCTLPLTAERQVNRIITNMAVMDVKPDGLHLIEIAPGTTVEQVQEATGARLIVGDVVIMRLI